MMPQGKQQSIIIPRYPQPIYWAYYPIPYPSNQANYYQQYPQHHPQNNMDEQNNSTYSFYGYQDNQNIDNISCYYPFYEQQNFYPINSQVSENKQNDEIQINDDNNKTKENNSSQLDLLKNNDKQWNKFDDNQRNIETVEMNIIHEEKEIDKINEIIINNEKDDTDSSELSSVENCQIDDDDIEEDSSTSTDSDSYLAYSTGRNIDGKFIDEKCKENDKQNSTDSESYSEEEEDDDDNDDEEEEEEEEDKKEEIKNFEVKIQGMPIRSDTPNEIDAMGWKDIPDEEEEELPTTVSVSLPLRLKFSVSKNHEEFATVIVGDSMIKSTQESLKINTKEEEEEEDKVSINLKINKEPNATVDFTLKKSKPTRPKSWCTEKLNDDFWSSETILGRQSLTSINSNNSCKTICEEIINKNDDDKLIIENHEIIKEKNDDEIYNLPQFEVTVDNNNEDKEDEEESIYESKKNKYLLTVQNSRDETDDDDSGVTSDMSRLISEVDTDSECSPSRKISSYKRTQTHSRLFRLLSEDSSIEDINNDEKIKRRNRLSLPLKNSSGFNYDCSNYSSGLTSPDYSPVYEPSWRQQNDLINNQNNDQNNTKDPYFKTWKESKEQQYKKQNHEVIPSFTTKIMENKMSWGYKSNVLCPRIKSTKSVPRALQGRICKPVIHPVPSCIKYDRC